jgi:hypothetical protein
MVPELSVEILDEIIDHVAVDLNQAWDTCANKETLDTLRACALTCSSTRPRAHKHIFAIIKIRRRAHANSMLRVLQRRPELAGCVQTLVVHPGPPLPDETWMYDPSPFSLVKLLPLFTNLIWLVFHCVEFNRFISPGHSLNHVIQAIPRTVHKLAFQRCLFDDDTVLIDIIRSVTSLHTLCVTYCPSMQTSPLGALAAFISPESLTIRALAGYGHCSISQSWKTILSFSALTELEFIISVVAETPLWQSVLDSAPLLRVVTILRLEHQSALLNLRNQHQLQALRIGAPMWDHGSSADNADPVAPLCNLLSSTRSPKLSYAELILEYPSSISLLELVDWENVKQVMEGLGAIWANTPKLVLTLNGHISCKYGMDRHSAEIIDMRDRMGTAWLHVNVET